MVTKGQWRQYFAAFSCQLSLVMTGCCFSWFTPLMVPLLNQEIMPITLEESSWMIAFIEVGELFSPIPVGMLVNRFGRKFWILSSFPLVLLSWALVLSTRSVEALLAVRFIQGLSVGIVFTVCPIYLAEIAEPKIRGAVCGHFQTMWIFGMVYAYAIGPWISYDAYAYASAALSLAFVVLFVWVPDSPYFYLLLGDEEKAEKSLSWLRGGVDVSDELATIKDGIHAESKMTKGGWMDLIKTAEDRRTLIVVSSVCWVKYMSGIPAILSYLTSTLTNSAATYTWLTPNLVSIFISLVILAATSFSASITDAIGRRPLVFISCVGSIVFNTTAACYYYLEYVGYPDIGNYVWVTYISLTLYCIINNLGLGPLLQTLQAECFSSQNRGIGGAAISIVGTVTTFIVLKQYQTVNTFFGVYMNYVVFALCSVLGSIFLFAFMKETAGKSLGEIQKDQHSKQDGLDLKY